MLTEKDKELRKSVEKLVAHVGMYGSSKLSDLVEAAAEAGAALEDCYFESSVGYEGETDVHMYFRRPETDEELWRRLNNERAATLERERRERIDYEKLKAKFEGKNESGK